MRPNRGTLILLVVLAVIIAGAVLMLRGNSNEADTASTTTTAPQALFEDITADDVTGLTLQAKVESGETPTANTVLTPSHLELAKDGEGNWGLSGESVDISELPLDQTRITGAVSTLVGLHYRDSFESDNLTQYGLDDPAYDITFTAGETTYRLRVGNKNIGGAQYYALRGDDDSMVYVLTSAASTDTVLKLVTDQPFVPEPTPTPVPVLTAPGPIFTGFPTADITRLSITNMTSGAGIELVKDEESGDWSMTGSETPVDQTQVSVVLSQFGSLNVVDALPGDNLAALGLDNPQYLILASLTEDKVYSVAVGNLDPTGTRYYTLVNDFKQVGVIESDLVDFVLSLLDNPPLLPEVTPEVTLEATEATTEATATGD